MENVKEIAKTMPDFYRDVVYRNAKLRIGDKTFFRTCYGHGSIINFYRAEVVKVLKTQVVVKDSEGKEIRFNSNNNNFEEYGERYSHRTLWNITEEEYNLHLQQQEQKKKEQELFKKVRDFQDSGYLRYLNVEELEAMTKVIDSYNERTGK